MEQSHSKERPIDVRVVGARVDHEGRVADMVAVAPPDAAELTSTPDAFAAHGDIAVMVVEPGRALREAGSTATDIMLREAEAVPYGATRTIASKALVGTVTLAELADATTQNLSGNSQ